MKIVIFFIGVLQRALFKSRILRGGALSAFEIRTRLSSNTG
jgi:hypothetical protein